MTGESFLHVYESRKIGQRSWRASGQLFDPGATGIARTVTSFAYCSDSAPATKARSASVTSAGGIAFFAADARCSSGKAQAGGFLGPPPKLGGSVNHQVTDSYRADKKTWRSRMRSSGFTGVTFTSYVYCADETKPAARTGSTSSSTSGTLHTALSAECKQGTKPVAGGFSQPNAAPTLGFFNSFYESFKSGKRWRVSARHVGATSTTLDSIVYCA